MNSQRISFGIWIYNLLCLGAGAGVAWLLLHSSLRQRFSSFPEVYDSLWLSASFSSTFLLPCGLKAAASQRRCASTCLFLEGHFGIHLEVASDSFCFIINSSWLLVFILYVFSLFFLGFNLYCLKGIHFS